MKRFMIFGLALLILGSGLFADDAKVMPLRTGRLSLAPSFTSGFESFGDNGSRSDSDTLKMFNFGAALEFGVTSWITGAVQWAPGINMYSKVNTQVPNPDNPSVMSSSGVRLLDSGDLFVGAKVQIFGKEAPIKNDLFRLAFAPGLKIPLQVPDYKEQLDNARKGDRVTAGIIDNHALATGLRSYFDYIVNDKFFINLYNEVLFYTQKKDFNTTGYQEALIGSLADQVNSGARKLATNLNPLLEPTAGFTLPDKVFDTGKVRYEYEVTIELEPTYSAPISKGVLFTASLPITYKTTPGKKYNYSYNADARAAYQNAKGIVDTLTPIPGMLTQDDIDDASAGLAQVIGYIPQVQGALDGLKATQAQTHALSVTPGLALFFYEWKLPTEFEIDYKVPLFGKNTKANHTFIFLVKLFFKV